MVSWLRTKRTIFDVQLCRCQGQAASCACCEEGARRSFPQKVSANLPLVCPRRGENAHKWSSETLPDVALDGKRVLTEGSERVPHQRGQRARWYITASLCAAIPRMRHSGVGKFASDQRGEGWA